MEMKPYSYLVILIWSILTSQSYSIPESRDAKSFTTFNPFPYYQNGIDSLGAQIHEDPFIDSLIRHSSYPSKGGYESLERMIAKLQHKVAEIKSQRLVCNSLMPAKSKVIGSVCYYVEPTPDTYYNALAKCRSYGGTLMEPLPSFSLSLWNALLTNFPSQMDPNQEYWIGATTPPTVLSFVWATTGTPVFPVPTGSAVVDAINIQGALLQTPGNDWNADDVNELYPYVCCSRPLKAYGHSHGYSKPYKYYEKIYS